MKKSELESQFRLHNIITSDPQYGSVSYYNDPKDPPRYAGGGLAKKAIEAFANKFPIELKRAKPLTKQEITEHADRVARQQSGEFVRKSEITGNPKDTQNLAGRSKKEVERLKKIDYTLEPTRELRPTPTYEGKVGDVNIALPGDQTVSDLRLLDVNGLPIESTQQGGSLYGEGKLHLEDPLFWASGEDIAQQFQDKVTALSHLYNTDDVMAYHLAMGEVANNYAMHFADANLRAIANSKPSKKAIREFNKVIRDGFIDPRGNKVKLPHFVGIENPEEAYLQMMEDPALRKWFNNRMKVDKYTTDIGLPSGKDIQWAITEPALRDMEINLTGHSVGKMVPEASLTDTADHATYEVGIPGISMGKAPELAPFELAFPDVTDYVRATQRPQDFTGTIQKVFPHQVMDQQQLDQMSEYYRRLREIRGFKKGGDVNAAGGGLIKNVAKKVLESKGKYGAERVEKAADLVPDLEKQFNEEALYRAFTGDNAKGVMVLDPAHFEEYAKPLPPQVIRPGKYSSKLFMPEDIPEGMSYSEYLDYLLGLKGGFRDIPYLEIADKGDDGFKVTGHEGRHRTRALSKRGDKKTLIQMLPGRGMREPFERRSQEEYIDAINAHLGLDPEVSPEVFPDVKLPLPKVFAKGGKAELEEEFKKANMIAEPRLIPKAVIKALDTKRKLTPAEAKIAGQYANPENQWKLGSILEEIDPIYTLGRGARALKDVDYGAIKDFALRRYELEPSLKKRREMMQRGGEQLGEVAFSALDVAPAVGAVASKTGRNLIKNLVKEFEGAPAGLSIKPVGGQWMTKRLDKELEGIAMPDTNAELNKAINGWIRGPLRKYIMNRMGTESDEIRKLYDAGIYHKPPQSITGYPMTLEEEELPAYMEKIRSQYPSGATHAKTPEGFKWEMSSDLAFNPKTARQIQESPMLIDQSPWASKLAPEEVVYGLSSRGYEGDTLRSLGFDHIVDVLKNDIREGKLRPEQLNKVSIEDAAKRTHQYNQEMAKKAEETIARQDEFLPKHREYPEGYKWVEVKHPTDKEKTEAALKYEGESMGHCVGAYCEDVMSGDTKIFSLRDPQGKPHVTIEVTPQDSPSLYEANRDFINSNPELANYHELINDTADSNAEYNSKLISKMRELGIEPRIPEGDFVINQIKGKGNEKPAAKYLPFVQDFVKNPPIGGGWKKIYDFENTDLIDATRMKEYGYLPDMDTKASNEVLSELNRIYPMEVSSTGVNLFEGQHGRLIDNFKMLKREVEDLQGTYLTKEDILQHLRNREARPVEQSYSKYYENPEEPQMAGGGSVKSLIKKLAKEFGESEPALKRGVAYNTYEQVPYAGADHLKGMPEKSYLEKLDFTNEANWDKNEDLLARYLGQESEPSQKGIGLYQPPIEGAPLEMNPQVSTRTKIDTEQQRRWRNEMTPESQANMNALGATRGYFDVQGASPWVRPSEGGKRKYNAFHVVVDGKPTQEEMMKLGEIQNKYGFYGTSDLGKSGVFVGFNFDYGLKDLKKMKSAFEADVKEALGNRVKGVKMVKSEGDYPGYEGKWEAPQGKGEVTRQFMDYLGGAAEQNPLLAEFYAQKPSTELQKLMESMNIRDIEAPAKYGVGAPRKDVLNAREIFAREGVEGLRRALERGEYLPAVGAIGLEGLNDKR